MWRKFAAGTAATITLSGGAVFGADRAQNPYEDKGTHYELPIQSDIPQGERVEIAKDKAAMTLKGWNDEYAITITPQIPTTPTFGSDTKIDRPFTVEADRPLLSKKMEYRKGDVTAFIEPKEGTDNEFDIDFTLHAKPETNVFEYKIEGGEDFTFLYQPALTSEEIASGSERPENVVGSYAVYHKTKANHRIGSTNYATGKAFHIYRPKAIDAKGAEVWAELLHDNGVLSVTVPQEFLDTASYPVTVDPTFGNTHLGATETTLNSNNAAALRVFPGTSGSLSKITAGVDQDSGTPSMKGVVWLNSDGTVITNGVTDPVLMPSSPAFTDASFGTPPSVTASTAYYIGVIFDASGTQILSDGTFNIGGYGCNDGVGQSYASPAAIDNCANPGYIYSIYATLSCVDGVPCTEVFNGSGYSEWTVPTGVSSIDVACWGGGGGGGQITGSGGGGGGGAGFASSTETVSPTNIVRLFIGQGGATETDGQASTASSTAPTLFVRAAGGDEAADATAGTVSSGSSGDVTNEGGAGGAGDTTDDTGGGGGGSAGPHGDGATGGSGSNDTTGGGGGGGNAGGNGGQPTAGTAGENAGAGGTGGDGGACTAGASGFFGGGGGGGADNGLSASTCYGGFPGGGGGGADATAGGGGGGGQCTITYTIAAAGGGAAAPTDIIWFE